MIKCWIKLLTHSQTSLVTKCGIKLLIHSQTSMVTKCGIKLLTHSQTSMVTKCGIKLLIHFQTSMVAPLKFGNGWIISSHTWYCLCYEIIYPFPNFNGCTIEVWEWINNFIPHCILAVLGFKLNHISERAPGGGGGGGGGTPYVMGDTYVPRFWPPFFTLAGSSTIFLGYFFSSTNSKAIFWGTKTTNFYKNRSFWPQTKFFSSIFLGPIFSGQRHTPISFQAEYPPRGKGPKS